MAIAYETSVPATYRDAFISKVVTISNRLGIAADWLMIVIRFESAGTFAANVTNRDSGAVGLIQFTETGIQGLGVTLAQLKAMSAVAQLDYVEKYLTPYRGRMKDLYDVYLAVFAPAYIGRPDAQVVYSASATTEVGKRRYQLNKVLDTNKDGKITIAEIKAVISRYIPKGADGLPVDDGKSNTTPLLAVGGLILLFLFFNRGA